MIKRLPSRNSRSKGIKLKHILQICLLLGICFWLVYQVKHSHDKKKEFDENDVTTSVRKMSEDEILKLGRKDLLHPLEDSAKSEKHVEEQEEETPAEEEEKHAEEERGDEGNKHEVDEREDEINKLEEEEREDEGNKHEAEEQDEEEEENKDEEVEDAERGGGDDEMDENDQERKEHEGDRDEEFIDEEKELEEEGDEKEGQTNEKEGKETQVENKNSSEHQDNDDGSQVSHEAREEHYKGDDASSAVTHDVRDSQVISTEPEKVNSENSEFNGLQKEHKTHTTEGDTRIENTSVSMVGEGEIARNGTYLNVSGVEEVDSSSSITENSQALVLSNNQTEARNNLTIGSTETGNIEMSTKVSDSSLSTGIGSAPHSNNAQNAVVDGATTVEGMKVETSFLEHTNNSNIASYGNQSDFNSPFPTDFEHQNATLGKSFDATDSNVAGKSLKLNGTAEAEDNHTSATTKVDADASRNDKSNSELESNRTRKISDSTNGTDDATQHDPVDFSVMHVTEAEKEIRIDTNALPDIKTEGDENEEAAAE